MQRPVPSVERLGVRDRLPDFLVLFALGLVLAPVAGLIISFVGSVGLGSSVGAAFVLLGAMVLLGGGLTGGNYAIGGIGRGVSRNSYMRGDGNDAMLDEWRAGYRPEADSAAIMLVIAGLGYLIIGAVVLSLMT